MRVWYLAIFLAVAGIAGTGSGAVADSDRPVVVELFTSQGCSSCPPAEAFLGDLAKREGVIALEYHIDYWDFIGWKDPFAKREFTDRQKGYVRSLGARYVYTPQMVIGGAVHEIGSSRERVEHRIRAERAKTMFGPKLEVRKRDGKIVAMIGSGHAVGEYDVLFVTFDKPHVTTVKRGENRGMTLTNANVVREYEYVGKWSGAAVEIEIPIAGRPGDGGCTVIVQKGRFGPIIAAATLPFDG